MKICPKCGKVVSYNSYFGAFICANCSWEDASIGQKRNRGDHNHSRKSVFKNYTKLKLSTLSKTIVLK